MRHNIFRIFPEKAVESFETMINKAVTAYEKDASKRKQSALSEARKNSQMTTKSENFNEISNKDTIEQKEEGKEEEKTEKA